jgi:hypothetical protein
VTHLTATSPPAWGWRSMIRRLVGILAAALAITALVNPASSAANAHPEEQRVTDGARGYWDFDGNSRGDRVLVWQGQDGLVMATAPPGRPFGSPRELPGTTGGSTGTLEVDEDGNALIVFHTGHGNTGYGYNRAVTVVPAGGAPSPPTTTSPGGDSLDLLDEEIGPEGDVALVYRTEQRGRRGTILWARFGRLDGGFGPAERVARIDDPMRVAAIRFTGSRAHVLYTSSTAARIGSRRVTLWERSRLAPGRWSTPRRLQTISMRPQSLRFVTDSRGGQVATWFTNARRAMHAYAAVRRGTGAFTMRRLGHERLRADRAPPLSAAIDPSGHALVAWPSQRRGDIVVARRLPGRGFDPAVHFAESTSYGYVSIAVNASGVGILTWLVAPFEEDLVAALRSSAGAEVDRTLLGSLPGTDSLYADVTIDRAGRGSVAWGWGAITVTSFSLE